MQNERVIWCGDFNVVLDEQLDLNKPAPRWRTMALRALMDDWELTDTWRALHPTEKRFSCYSKSTGTLSRLDLILASPSFLTHLLDVDIGISYQSDHSPVVLQFTLNENERGRGFWRMPDYVISDPEFQARVAAEVKTISICNLEATPNLLWDTVKASIRGVALKYTAEIKRNKKAQIESVEVQIAENVLHRDEAVSSETIRHYDDKVKYLQLELDDIYQSQNNLSRQYNTAQKYYFSERSSRYFLKKKFCTKNAIKVLVNSQGEQVRSDRQILQEGFKFYSTLYRKPAHHDAFNTGLLAKFLNKIPGDRIPLSAHTMLDKPFTRVELFNALKAMKKNTSPGTDGITVNFYLTFWPLLGEMVFNSLMDAQRTGKMSISQRRGLIWLIPKEGKNMLNIANWRPITLLNVDFKILTKALALRLGQILPDLLHNDQKGFVRGRYSGENILDVYAMIQKAQNDDQEYALLMLDIEKAFDSILLHFLEEVLFAFGVPPRSSIGYESFIKAKN